MLVDFGILKHFWNDFIDSFDHSTAFWNLEEDGDVISFFVKNFERVIVTPFSSSAESQALMFAGVCDAIFQAKRDQEEWKDFIPSNTTIHGARVHETLTGWAEAKVSDLNIVDTLKDYSEAGGNQLPKVLYPIRTFSPNMASKVLGNKSVIWISEGIAAEWKNADFILEDYNNRVAKVNKGI